MEQHVRPNALDAGADMKALLCRLIGWFCAHDLAQTRDLVSKMKEHSRKAEAETIALRQYRAAALDDAFFAPPSSQEQSRRAE